MGQLVPGKAWTHFLRYQELLRQQGLTDRRLFGPEGKRFEEIVTVTESDDLQSRSRTIVATYMREYLDTQLPEKTMTRRELVESEAHSLYADGANYHSDGLDPSDVARSIDIDEDSVLQALIDSKKWAIVSAFPEQLHRILRFG